MRDKGFNGIACIDVNTRQLAVPVLYVRGTHYDVGHCVGRTFGSVIRSFVSSFVPLREFIAQYETKAGRAAYEETLRNMEDRFPQYVREIEGTAHGSGVPFYKLFLLQMDDIIESIGGKDSVNYAVGCTDIAINEPGAKIMGHTEDALSETLNHFYLLSAHIITDEPMGRWQTKEEHFTSLCYAGQLPGYTMGYNHHGLVFTINTLSPKRLQPGRTPRTFLSRAVLAASSEEMVQDILTDMGSGAANGFSLNMTFIDKEGPRILQNFEVAPNFDEDQSLISAQVYLEHEFLVHCNRYLRLKVNEAKGPIIDSSNDRQKTIGSHKQPKTKEDIKSLLSDHSSNGYNIFANDDDIRVKTIAVGVFDLLEKTWSLYIDKPESSAPVAVLPIVTKKK